MRSHKISFLIFLFLFLLTTTPHSYGAIEVLLSGQHHGKNPEKSATDLIYTGPTVRILGLTIATGDVISPDNIKLLKSKGYIQDVSQLNPTNVTNLWTPQILSATDPNNKRLDQKIDDPALTVQPNDVLTYFSDNTWIQHLESAEFQVQANNSKTYKIIYGRNLHNYLLNKALLRKLGYQVPPSKWLRQVKVQFPNTYTMKSFIQKLKTNIGGLNPRRWIVNIEKMAIEDKMDSNGNPIETWQPIEDPDTQNNILVLQDVLVKNLQDDVFDYSFGARNPQMKFKDIDKRVLRSLAVPFHLNDINESVNKLSLVIGRTKSGTLFLPYKYGVAYEDIFNVGLKPDEDDLIWALRRLGQLTREDFQDMVDQAYLPKEVGIILVEKLIERRNDFIKQLLLSKNECRAPANPTYCRLLPNDLTKSQPPLLVEGFLTIDTSNNDPSDPKSWWLGYASRFSFGYLESPINGAEILSLVGVKTFSNIWSDLFRRINKDLVTEDITEKYIEHQNELITKQIKTLLQKGEVEKINFGFWTYPTASGRLISSRDVIFGNYLGTENNIQVARSAGFYVDAGFHIGTHGAATGVFAAGEAKLYYTKLYTHIKPIYSVKQAFKQHFDPINLIKKIFSKEKQKENQEQSEFLTQLMRGQLAKQLNAVLQINVEEHDNTLKIKNGLPQKTVLYETLSSALRPFKDYLGVGESLVISDNYGPKMNFKVGKGVEDNLELSAQFQAQLKSLKRIQITRAKDEELHIYITPGLVTTMGLGFDVTTYFRLLSGRYNRQSSEDFAFLNHLPKTYFYKVDLNPGKISIDDRPGLGKTVVHDDFVARTEFVEEMRTLKNVLKSSDLSYIKEVLANEQTPTTVQHRFTEHSFDGQLLLWQALKVNLYDQMEVQLPEDKTPKEFFRVTSGLRTGVNYQNLFFNITNSILDKEYDSEIQLDDGSNGNPGDTIAGRSHFRLVSFESKSDKNIFYHQSLKEPFAQVHYQWKGWSLNNEKKSRKNLTKLEKALSEINQRYQINELTPLLISPKILHNTTKLQLYTLDIYQWVYERGISYLAQLGAQPENFSTNYENYQSMTIQNQEVFYKYKLEGVPQHQILEHLFKRHSIAALNETDYERENLRLLQASPSIAIMKKFKKYQKAYLGYLNGSHGYKKNAKKAARAGLRLLDIAESQFPLDLFIEMIGGLDHIYIHPVVKGFRLGDETSGFNKADSPHLLGNGLGHIGSKKVRGGLQFVIDKSGMSESALLLNWLLRQL